MHTMSLVRPALRFAALTALAVGGLLGATGAKAQLACNLRSVQPVLFGAYNPLSANPLDAQSSITVRCTGLAAPAAASTGGCGCGAGRCA